MSAFAQQVNKVAAAKPCQNRVNHDTVAKVRTKLELETRKLFGHTSSQFAQLMHCVLSNAWRTAHCR